MRTGSAMTEQGKAKQGRAGQAQGQGRAKQGRGNAGDGMARQGQSRGRAGQGQGRGRAGAGQGRGRAGQGQGRAEQGRAGQGKGRAGVLKSSTSAQDSFKTHGQNTDQKTLSCALVKDFKVPLGYHKQETNYAKNPSPAGRIASKNIVKTLIKKRYPARW